jgi:hypothetical protein
MKLSSRTFLKKKSKAAKFYKIMQTIALFGAVTRKLRSCYRENYNYKTITFRSVARPSLALPL